MNIAKIKYKKIAPNAMFLHTELAKGTLGKETFQLIQSINNQIFVLNYKGKKYEIKTFALVKGLLDSIDKQK